ncbi:MAG: helix-turn-helix domain-containing protein [Clostridiales Family XIII bacterium]|jgi:transcriptional regulator with XRE-family HTH domain|nr:helix-turn-helix domain-containing protein [Clostridiales Family XIII bacterium]
MINNIRQIRNLLGIEVETLADYFLISNSAYKHWESGISTPNEKKMNALVAYFANEFYIRIGKTLNSQLSKKRIKKIQHNKNVARFSMEYLKHVKITPNDEYLLSLAYQYRYGTYEKPMFYFPGKDKNFNILEQYVSQHTFDMLSENYVLNYPYTKDIAKPLQEVNKIIIKNLSQKINVFIFDTNKTRNKKRIIQDPITDITPIFWNVKVKTNNNI